MSWCWWILLFIALSTLCSGGKSALGIKMIKLLILMVWISYAEETIEQCTIEYCTKDFSDCESLECADIYYDCIEDVTDEHL